MKTPMAVWQDGLEEELSFWRVASAQHPEWFDAARYFTELLDLDVEAAIESIPNDPLYLCDVGCGMRSGMGRVSRSGRQIIPAYVDPLIERFYQIARANGTSMAHGAVACAAEALGVVFLQSSFDVIFSRNALDHCYDPILALAQMRDVTAEGGSIVLKHYLRCGQRNAYRGLHQWDFFVQGSKLWLGCRDSAQTCIDDMMRPMELVTLEPYKEGPEMLIKAVYRKPATQAPTLEFKPCS